MDPLFEDVWTLLKMGIFQPAMLVCQRVYNGGYRADMNLAKPPVSWVDIQPSKGSHRSVTSEKVKYLPKKCRFLLKYLGFSRGRS